MPRPALPRPSGLATLCGDLHAGRMGRREFLGQATALGVGAAAALVLAGLPGPARAQPAIARGGTLRIQQNVKPLGDPRSYDWSEMGNQTRGFLEYLVEYQSDGTFHGMLLQGWSVSEDATSYVLRLRPGVRWNNGDAFTAAHVAHNIARWCDTTAPGNSMASRMTPLIDATTGQARADAIEITDPLTVTLYLDRPDISLIASMSDYPAAIVHPGYDGGDPFAHGVGTGPFRPVSLAVGERCVLERHPDHRWWGAEVFGGPWLERVEFVDLGTNPTTWLAAAEAGEIDMLYESVGAFIPAMDAIGWTDTSVESAATIVFRGAQDARIIGTNPYARRDMRRALALAVDNAICLELGYDGRGTVAGNDHVSPLHPAHADLGPARYDPGEARRLATQAGLMGFKHELVTLDDEWQRASGDAVAAQLRDAGLRVVRRIVPGATFWANWRDYPFSGTQWNHRPLAVQVLGLAYRSGAAWNETGFANAEFDALLDEANALFDAEARRRVMARLQAILRDEGVIIQPYWRDLHNHHNGRLVNAEKHPSHEIHLYRIGFAA
ncbi:peptide/nickel transport system substrate-binding protein [Roseovarius sp. MBR-78]|uniref:ABC transporter substrate-binding protein n=1 Tax=Roseovarius sp. MBR-78 TaxID=3156460 RepID=UPI003394DD7A